MPESSLGVANAAMRDRSSEGTMALRPFLKDWAWSAMAADGSHHPPPQERVDVLSLVLLGHLPRSEPPGTRSSSLIVLPKGVRFQQCPEAASPSGAPDGLGCPWQLVMCILDGPPHIMPDLLHPKPGVGLSDRGNVVP